jgi:hypothetical protein
MRKVAVATRQGMEETDAYYVRQGLAVTRMIDAQRWHVTHLASGLALDNGFTERWRAKAYQEALLALAIDWQQDRQVILQDKERIRRTFQDFNCYYRRPETRTAA